MPCTVDLVAVDPSVVEDIWPHARPLVKSAIDRTRLCNFDHIEREVLAGLQQLWLGWDGTSLAFAGVTQLVLINGEKICILVAVGGRDRNRWLPLLGKIEQFAKAEGCSAVRLTGRKGWQRILADYRANYVVMDRKL